MLYESLRATFHEAFSLYREDDDRASLMRAQHLEALLRMTPAMMAANLVCGTLVVMLIGAAGGSVLLIWAAALATTVGLAVSGARRWHTGRRRCSVRTFRRAGQHAAMLGLLWGVVPVLWFAGGSPAQQIVIPPLIAGLMACGSFVLALIPGAAIAYVGAMLAGSLASLLLDLQTPMLYLLALQVCFAVAVLWGSLVHAGQANALQRARAEQAKQRELVGFLLRDFEENAADALWETDASGRLTHASTRLLQLMQQPAAAGQSLTDWLRTHAADGAAAVAWMAGTQPVRDLRLQVQPIAGATPRWWLLTAKPVHPRPAEDGRGSAGGWRGVVSDITAAVEAEQRLHQLANLDPLTGLANRASFRGALLADARQQRPGALLAVDLDHFKAVNDAHGHPVGDALLAEVAQRLRTCVRPDDTVARLGGDEFAVWVRGSLRSEELDVLALRVIQQLSRPFVLDGRSLHVGASIGIASANAADGDVDDWIVRADLALYQAKADGRGRHAHYTSRLGERSQRALQVERALRDALARGELELHYQPRVQVSTRRIAALEALMRWRHPELGVVAPGEFIAVAERAGLIHELGDWALHEACRTVAALPALVVAVNVSAAQLLHGDFPQRVRSALEAAELDAGRLELEITESVLLDDGRGALDRLHQLAGLGVRIALDDFGTGYSSLAYLRRFPFDVLKIDRSFVCQAVQNEQARAIVETIVALARRLGMHSVAEGVETLEELQVMRDCGCDEVQGYLLARPQRMSDLEPLLQGHAPVAAAHALH